MADQQKQQIDENEVTTVAPANADQTSNPVDNDAKSNQAPVRTNRADVPVAASLASGAGAHEARELDREVDGVKVDKDGLDRDGRLVAPAK